MLGATFVSISLVLVQMIVLKQIENRDDVQKIPTLEIENTEIESVPANNLVRPHTTKKLVTYHREDGVTNYTSRNEEAVNSTF